MTDLIGDAEITEIRPDGLKADSGNVAVSFGGEGGLRLLRGAHTGLRNFSSLLPRKA